MTKLKRYTPQEDELIKKALEESYDINQACKVIKNLLPDRSLSAIRTRIYLNFKEETKKIKNRTTFKKEEEDTLIFETLNKYSFNLELGFEELAEKLGRTVKSLKFRWYTKLKRKTLNNGSHPFAIVGKENHGSCKNIWRDKTEQREDFRIGINGIYYNSATSTFCNNLTF